VQVEVHGMPMDYVSASSKIANNTGRLKLEQLFEFEVAYPELAILLITIKVTQSRHGDVQPERVAGYGTHC
jgi:hypothetical protein